MQFNHIEGHIVGRARSTHFGATRLWNRLNQVRRCSADPVRIPRSMEASRSLTRTPFQLPCRHCLLSLHRTLPMILSFRSAFEIALSACASSRPCFPLGTEAPSCSASLSPEVSATRRSLSATARASTADCARFLVGGLGLHKHLQTVERV